jgi:hypothetical protein
MSEVPRDGQAASDFIGYLLEVRVGGHSIRKRAEKTHRLLVTCTLTNPFVARRYLLRCARA